MAKEDVNSKRPFRIVIVGAGIVGLSLSHALSLANIDHVVLEKQNKIVSLHGAALMFYPGTARIMDQFGIYKRIQQAITPITSECQRWPDGSINIQSNALRTTSEMFEAPVILFDREKCVTHLYETLPDQSKIRTNARVERIEHTTNGVKVFLADGSVEEADMVIGADGVHSLVRELMWDYAAKNEPDAIPESDKTIMSTQYKGIFGVSDTKNLAPMGDADVNIIYGHGAGKLLFTQPGQAYWALIYKDEYSAPPKKWRPDEEEKEAVAARFKDIQMTDKLTFAQCWENKSRGGLVNIEEGTLDKWHAGRIVLVGDSAHKMTADIGIGANMAIESAVALCNILQRETKGNLNRHFETSELSTLFQEYQDKRHERAKTFMTLSGGVTRMRSYESLWKRIFISRIAALPYMQKAQSLKMMTAFSMAPKLDYVPVRTLNEDAEGWKLGQKAKQAAEAGSGAAWYAYALVTSAVGVGLSYAAVLKWGLPQL